MITCIETIIIDIFLREGDILGYIIHLNFDIWSIIAVAKCSGNNCLVTAM
jgi:hypothetical protein